MAKLLLILAIFAWPCLSEIFKILVVFPFPMKSHSILGEGFVKVLLKAGHEVTYITPFPKKDAKPGLRYIDVSENLDTLPSMFSNLKSIVDKDESVYDYKLFFNFIKNLSKSTFANKEVTKLMNDPNEKFDLVIIEWMFSEVYVGLAAVFDCPYIWSSSVEPHSLVLSLIDEGLNPAYNPSSMASNIPPFNFVQRVEELFGLIIMKLSSNFLLLPNDRQNYEAIFGKIIAKKSRQLPSFEEMRYNASFMFGNSDVSVGRAVRLPQNYKPIGGYHIDPDVKPLPEDLKNIMEVSNAGVIYFSMGSSLKSKDLPDEIKQSLLKMFVELKYTVIWKFEEQLSDLPKNVHILQWAPQPSILAHPKCKLFITHGGLLSTIEAVHFGVPIIGVPTFADQFVNVDFSKKKGFALKVDLSYDIAKDLKLAIEEILGDPKYKKKMDELNLIYHDRPVPPTTEIVHWVNHVIRTNGAPHLRSVALMMPWYQKWYLDFLALVLVLIVFIVKAIKFICGSNKKQVSSKKKNN